MILLCYTRLSIAGTFKARVEAANEAGISFACGTVCFAIGVRYWLCWYHVHKSTAYRYIYPYYSYHLNSSILKFGKERSQVCLKQFLAKLDQINTLLMHLSYMYLAECALHLWIVNSYYTNFFPWMTLRWFAGLNISKCCNHFCLFFIFLYGNAKAVKPQNSDCFIWLFKNGKTISQNWKYTSM